MIQLKLTQSTPLVQETDGTVHVIDSRITLDTIVRAFKNGASAEQIQDSFPSLTLREIYSTIAYYLNNQEAVENYLMARHKEAQVVKQEIENQQNTLEFRERLRARREQLVQT
jgi:uncharacterized protein (DUF433 family)